MAVRGGRRTCQYEHPRHALDPFRAAATTDGLHAGRTPGSHLPRSPGFPVDGERSECAGRAAWAVRGTSTDKTDYGRDATKPRPLNRL